MFLFIGCDEKKYKDSKTGTCKGKWINVFVIVKYLLSINKSNGLHLTTIILFLTKQSNPTKYCCIVALTFGQLL